jgi:hypothetical protein
VESGVTITALWVIGGAMRRAAYAMCEWSIADVHRRAGLAHTGATYHRGGQEA